MPAVSCTCKLALGFRKAWIQYEELVAREQDTHAHTHTERLTSLRATSFLRETTLPPLIPSHRPRLVFFFPALVFFVRLLLPGECRDFLIPYRLCLCRAVRQQHPQGGANDVRGAHPEAVLPAGLHRSRHGGRQGQGTCNVSMVEGPTPLLFAVRARGRCRCRVYLFQGVVIRCGVEGNQPLLVGLVGSFSCGAQVRVGAW